MFGDFSAIIFVLVVLALLMQGLFLYQRAKSPHPEVVRKIVHAVMGGVTLWFPYIFQSALSVFMLALVAGGGLTYIKQSRKLRGGVADVLCAVKRQSYGEVSFVAAIAVLFALAQHQPLLYAIPVLILTLADSISALVGIFAGKRRFTTSEGTKSAEGSFAFFVTTFFATAIPLLMFSTIAAPNIILISLLLGGLVMMFEAISWRGLDNFLIPISAFVLLSIYMTLDFQALLSRFLVASVLLSFALYWRSRTALHDGAAIGAALACYASTAIGGVEWLLAPLTVFSLHKFALPQRYHAARRTHSVRAVISVASIGLLWLLASKITGNSDLFFPYTVSFALNFAMIATAHLQKLNYKSYRGGLLLMLTMSVLTWAIFFLPYVGLAGINAEHLRHAALALPLVLLSGVLFYGVRIGRRQCLSSGSRWARQIGVVACVSPLAMCCL